MFRPTPQRGRRPGSVLPLVCITLVFLVGMVAFAIDTGYVALTRTQMQEAADAGAHAGAFKLATFDGQSSQDAAARTEARTFVGYNDSLTVPDGDIKVFRYNPYKAAGQRVSAGSASLPPNAVEVTLRRDAQANGPVSLYFGPVLGTSQADVRAKSVAYLLPAGGILPGAPLIPFAMHVDYYYAAVGQARTDPDGVPIPTTDTARVKDDGTVVSGSDGIKEVVLFSGTRQSPGNFGSVDLGSASNGTPELRRQILYGPTWNDFHDPDFRDKLQRDGSLAAPVNLGGDPGLSTSVKDSFDQVIGKPRIIPLFDTVTGNGNNTVYHVVGFAAVVITAVDLQGSPKQVWIQPSRLITSNITPADPDTATTEGVFGPPRLVVLPPG
jgi:hypothetical protein